ncbi:MAG: Smr/MutS family protein, partial [Candidatus Bipolaricaulia bacterium]
CELVPTKILPEERLREVGRLRREYEERLRQFREEKEQALSEELRRLEELVQEAKRELEEALHRAREGEEARRALRGVLEVEERLKEAGERLARREAELSIEDLTPGERVFLRGAERVGVVREVIDADRLELEIGGVRVWTRLSDLRLPPEASHEEVPRFGPSYELSAAPEVKLELGVHGLTAVEALSKVDRYLDRLLLSDIPRGYIIHGKGSGTLRRAIREHLKELPFVKDFHSAPPREGGDGVTIVELDVD